MGSDVESEVLVWFAERDLSCKCLPFALEANFLPSPVYNPPHPCPAAEECTDAISQRSLGPSLTSCYFLAEPQAQLRGDLLDSRAALHGKRGGSSLVLQPAPEGKTDQLPNAIPHQIAHLQFQTGEILGVEEPTSIRAEMQNALQWCYLSFSPIARIHFGESIFVAKKDGRNCES